MPGPKPQPRCLRHPTRDCPDECQHILAKHECLHDLRAARRPLRRRLKPKVTPAAPEVTP